MDGLILLPRPRQLDRTDGSFKIFEGLKGFLERVLKNPKECSGSSPVKGLSWSVPPKSVSHPQGYELEISLSGIELRARTVQGRFYGLMTLRQILVQSDQVVPCLSVKDWPDFPHRGVMLDISRDKVPTMATLFSLMDKLASWKLNQFQLYMEHTFAYKDHAEVWKEWSPMTGEEIRQLDAYCQARFIELVPNQNSFGHMSRWLTHEKYRPMAEAPQGCMTKWGKFDDPFSLCPTDERCLPFMSGLFDDLLPNFSSRQVNVGCDETVDVGQARSKEIVAQKGEGRVWLDYVMGIYQDITRRGLTMQFWGDIIVMYPPLVPDLPKDVVLLEWGYEGDHPFDAHGALFKASGVPFYVCPGTGGWNSIGGRTENAVANLKNAAENGLKHGAVGYLVTDWGDNGHMQPLPVSYLGYGYGAALAWCGEANRGLPILEAISLHAFGDASGATGKLAYDLGNAYLNCGARIFNASALVHVLLLKPDLAKEIKDLSVEGMERAQEYVNGVAAGIGRAAPTGDDASLVKEEFTWAADMLRHACRRGVWVLGKGGLRPGSGQGARKELEADARSLIREHRRIWMARNREGGFHDSVVRLERTIGHDYKGG